MPSHYVRTNLPRYQRAYQKLLKTPPHVKAVLSSAKLDEAIADEEMRRNLRLSELGTRTGIERERLDLLEDRIDYFDDQRKAANIIAGVGIPVEAAGAYIDLLQKRKMANYLRGMTA
jgi:hypothetical protein